MFVGYQPYKGDVDKSRKGSLISGSQGVTSAFALNSVEARGILFVKPGDKVYPGQIIGEHNKDMDLEVNPVKTKQITNSKNMGDDHLVL